MSTGSKLTGLLLAGILCLPMAFADTQPPPTHHPRAKKKADPVPPPLPSGTRGPVPQVPLDAIPAVQPQVTYENGLLTIVAPNSTLSDILKGVRKNTSAEIEIPATANERVVTRLGPASAREVMAELLNGSRFNYILLGSPEDANALVRVVLVAKSGPDNPPSPTAPAPAEGGAVATPAQPGVPADSAQEVEPEDAPDDSADQSAEGEQQNTTDPGVKTPQQLLQEMNQRQFQMQQQQQQQQPGYPPAPGAPPRQPQQQQQNQ